MPGVPDSAYVAARRVLLDALDALTAHLDALVLVGAQAIYLHTGEGDLAVAPYTTDADIAVDPGLLTSEPALEETMLAAGFVLGTQPGVWFGTGAVEIDLLVPEAVGGEGRRGARLGTHGSRAARKARGLEAALVDNTPMEIRALEGRDDRRFELAVAGPAALLVAKLHKLAERQGAVDRLQDKDALDVLRLLRETETEALATTMRELLANERSAQVTHESIDHLLALFGADGAAGSQMAARAAQPLEDPATIAGSVTALAADLLHAVEYEPFL